MEVQRILQYTRVYILVRVVLEYRKSLLYQFLHTHKESTKVLCLIIYEDISVRLHELPRVLAARCMISVLL